MTLKRSVCSPLQVLKKNGSCYICLRRKDFKEVVNNVPAILGLVFEAYFSMVLVLFFVTKKQDGALVSKNTLLTRRGSNFSPPLSKTSVMARSD